MTVPETLRLVAELGSWNIRLFHFCYEFLRHCIRYSVAKIMTKLRHTNSAGLIYRISTPNQARAYIYTALGP
jgi:hypothetical protein